MEISRFGPFELHPSSRELYKFGTKLKLRPQPFQVLKLLLDQSGEVVSREQLRQLLWPSDTFVDFEHSLNTAIKELRAVLDDSATEPRYIQTIPKLGYRFITPVEHSTQSVRSGPLVGAAEPQPVEPHVLVSPPVVTGLGGRTWKRLSVVAAAILLLVIGVTLARNRVLRWPASGAVSAAPKPRPSIAVLGFKNLSGQPEEEWMSTALEEMLSAELASGQQIRVIPSENITRMKFDLSLAPTDTYGRETLDKIHNYLGTDLVASGSFLALAEGPSTKLRIVLQVQDTRTGETVAAFREDGNESDLPELISGGGDNLRRTLGIGALSATAMREVRASAPSNSESERLYAEGLAKLQGFDALAARALLEKAIAADPNHALSHSALAESLSILGYDLKAQAEAKKALELSSNLSREDRLSIEGRYRELTQDRPAAVEIYRTLHNFFPDNLDYALRFANAQVRAGQAADAVQTVAAMRNLPAPLSNDARIDIAEAYVEEHLGEPKQSQVAAAAGIARAKSQGSALLMAAAMGREAIAWVELAEPDKALADDNESRRLWLAAGDARAAASAIHGVAIVEEDEGKLSDAHTAYEEALAEFRRIGAQWDTASCSHNLGILDQEMGDLEEAKSHLEDALRIQRALNDRHGVAADLDDLSNVLLSAGQLPEAIKMKKEAVQIFQDIGEKRAQSIAMFNLGEVLYQSGEIAAAEDKYREAMAIQQKIEFKTGLGYSMLGTSEILAAQDHLEEAREFAEKSLSVRNTNKEEVYSAQSDLQLAEISLDESKPDEAASLAEKSSAVFEKQGAPDSAAQGYSVLARSLVAEGKFAEAKSAANRANALAEKSGDHMVRLQAGLASAEVEAKSGQVSDAERHLGALHDQAKREGYAVFEFEARLLSAQAELESGQPTVARARLDKLQSDARKKGFLLIARDAGVARLR